MSIDAAKVDFQRGTENTLRTSPFTASPSKGGHWSGELDPFDLEQTAFDYKDGVKVSWDDVILRVSREASRGDVVGSDDEYQSA